MSTNLTPHDGVISREQREALLGQRGAIVWFTGLSGSGKSTVARAVEERLFALGRACYVLDGDTVRTGLCAGLDFSTEGRAENIRRVAHAAALLADAGVLTLCAFISPFRAGRAHARSLVPAGRFFEVHVDCPLDACEQRDVKGLYARARAGDIPAFTGVDSPYESPETPELRLDTTKMSVDECVEKVVEMLLKTGVM